MDRVHAGEVALATRVWPGGEPTIVGIHGLTANHTCWYPVAEALVLGVLDHFEVERAVVMGHSLGAAHLKN